MKTKVFKVHPTYPELDKIEECAKVIQNGGLVIFPTETVYGIACDFGNAKALARLKKVKRRSQEKPFPVLISRKDLVDVLANPLNLGTYKLIDTYWPGPLTLIVPTKDQDKTIGLRMPKNTIALYLTHQANCPLAAPSANLEGQPSPATCEEALKDMEGLIEIAIDGGPTTIGKASTVVDITSKEPRILRQGPISEADIKKTIKQKIILFVCTGNSCRSVMAAHLLKSMLGNRTDVDVISAGTSVYVSMGASENTLAVLKEEGLDASVHQARHLGTTIIKKSDLILTMTRRHRQYVLDKVPSSKNRVYLLKEFANMPQVNEQSLDIPDPMGRSLPEYKECIKIIKEAIIKVVDLI